MAGSESGIPGEIVRGFGKQLKVSGLPKSSCPKFSRGFSNLPNLLGQYLNDPNRGFIFVGLLFF